MALKLKIDIRPFRDRIIYGLGYREGKALTMTEDIRHCVGDEGALMPIQGFCITTVESGRFTSRCNDLKRLDTWSDHYKACNAPFLVLRISNMEVVIYKERMVLESGQVQWNRKQRLLEN